MASAEVIVVGAGAAGVWAARGLSGRNVLVLDVGHTPAPSALRGNLFDLRSGGAPEILFEELIGPGFESLHNVFHPFLSPKLKAPRMRFVTAGADALSPVQAHGFEPAMSFAEGGLANAWGAGLYRYDEADLAAFPIGPKDLDACYDRLTAEVGISGADDDLSEFFGSTQGLQPPLEMDANGQRLLRRYARSRQRLRRAGLTMGRPRLAVLSRPLGERPAYGYEALEFFRADNPSVYSPAYTLREMVRRQDVAYEPGVLVERYAEEADAVTVTARPSAGGPPRQYRCRRLVLAAGALNTAKIALRSRDDHETRLPVLDNPVSYVPLLDPLRIGAGLEKAIFPAAMLNAVYTGPRWPARVQMTLYGVAGTLRSDYLFDFPLSARGCIAAARYLTPALTLAQLFYPDAPLPTNTVGLTAAGELEIRYAAKRLGTLEPHLLRMFRGMGYLGLARLCRFLAPGNSFHYAGPLPMRATPGGPYDTDRDGRLAGSRRVYVADAAVFPALPAKNHSFTMMANALRVGAHVAGTLP